MVKIYVPVKILGEHFAAFPYQYGIYYLSIRNILTRTDAKSEYRAVYL